MDKQSWAIKKNVTLIMRATAKMNLEIIVLSQRSESQMAIYYMTLVMRGIEEANLQEAVD
jgi:hypothetical protein